MLIVAIDTSGKQGSVALCRGDQSSCEILGLIELAGGSYSARLIPSLDELLRRAGLDKSNLDGFVVVDGPGSFTGLRVGLSTAKALCEALQKPLATVSMLEALAVIHGADSENVAAVLDAGRNELYVGNYRCYSGEAELIQQSIEKMDDFLAGKRLQGARVITPYGKIEDAKIVEPLRADAVARIGLRKLEAGETADLETLDANYIRRSDAELFSLTKR